MFRSYTSKVKRSSTTTTAMTEKADDVFDNLMDELEQQQHDNTTASAVNESSAPFDEESVMITKGDLCGLDNNDNKGDDVGDNDNNKVKAIVESQGSTNKEQEQEEDIQLSLSSSPSLQPPQLPGASMHVSELTSSDLGEELALLLGESGVSSLNLTTEASQEEIAATPDAKAASSDKAQGPQDDEHPLYSTDMEAAIPKKESPPPPVLDKEDSNQKEPSAEKTMSEKEKKESSPAKMQTKKSEQDAVIATVDEAKTGVVGSFTSTLWSSIVRGGVKVHNKPKAEDNVVKMTKDEKTCDVPPVDKDMTVKPEKDVDNKLSEDVDIKRSESVDSSDTKHDEDDAFNPFVNIGNRLLDSEGEAPQEDDDSAILVYKQVLASTVTVVMVLLQGLVKVVSFGARNIKPICFVLAGCALGFFIQGFLSLNLWGSSMQGQEAVSAWNSSTMEDLTPPVVMEVPRDPTNDFSSETPIINLIGDDGESIHDQFESSTMRDLFSLLKVMVVSMTASLAGFSLVGVYSSDKNNANVVNSYSKDKDDRSRYVNLSVKDLKQKLRARNLCTTGNHSHLVDRLVNDDTGESNDAALDFEVDVEVVKRNTTVKALQEELRRRNLPVTGLKEDLIVKVWIPERVKELKLCTREELRGLLDTNNLSKHGKSKEELIRRLIETGH